LKFSVFQRALPILESAFGPKHQNLVSTLDGYAALLRKTRREAEAAVLEARGNEIRAMRGEKVR